MRLCRILVLVKILCTTVATEHDPEATIALAHDKLFLEKSDLAMKAGDYEKALVLNKTKETALYSLICSKNTTFVCIHNRIRRLQDQMGLLRTMALRSSTSDPLERTEWSFRLLSPSLDQLLARFTNDIDCERKGVLMIRKKSVEALEKRMENPGLRLIKVRARYAKEKATCDAFKSIKSKAELATFLESNKPCPSAYLEALLCEMEELQEIIRAPDSYVLKLERRKIDLAEMEAFSAAQTAKIQRKIEFIAQNESLFVTGKVDRFRAQGVRYNSETNIEYFDPVMKQHVAVSSPGDHVVVTVVDSNMFQKQKEAIHPLLRSQMTNPEENCYYVMGMTGAHSGSHATNVASVIVLDHQGVGLACKARTQLIPYGRAMAKMDSKKEEGDAGSFTESFYYSLLDDFDHGYFVFDSGNLCSDPNYDATAEVQGKIVNLSVSINVLNRWGAHHESQEEDTIESFYFWWKVMSRDRKLLVEAAGNEGVYAGSGFMHRTLKAIASHPSTSPFFIMVTNLCADGLHPNPTSTLPGRHLHLQKRSISAIGTSIDVLANSPQDTVLIEQKDGTSFSAPFVSGVAAVILGAFPKLSMDEIASCILDSATPIILLGTVPSFRKPVALDTMAYRWTAPGICMDFDGDPYTVTEAMMQMSRENYGQGRVNLERALELASLLNWAKSDPSLANHVATRDYDYIRSRFTI